MVLILIAIGGVEVYRQALPFSSRAFLTRVHGIVHGDAFFDLHQISAWRELSRPEVSAGERNSHDFSIIELENTQTTHLVVTLASFCPSRHCTASSYAIEFCVSHKGGSQIPINRSAARRIQYGRMNRQNQNTFIGNTNPMTITRLTTPLGTATIAASFVGGASLASVCSM